MKGIDVSNHNGNINFNKVKVDGVEAVYIKATEGTTYKDRYLDTNYSNAHYAGLKTGFYHFLVGTSAPESQAVNFYNAIKDKASDLIPMLDIETAFSGLVDYALRFIAKFKEISNLPIGVYTYTGFMCNLDKRLSAYPLWEANYNNSPWSLPDNFFLNRVGHQYTEKGKVNGINTAVDLNEFTEGILLNSKGEWIQDKNTKKWWYKHSDGSYTKADWEKIDGKWYLFDLDGWMLYDWKKDNGTWYYLGKNDDGSMKFGWLLQDNKWYYLDESNNGAMKTGWQKIDGTWYFFDASGAMKTGWIKDNGKDYCLYSNGTMICNTSAYGYRFDSNGVATKLG